jgi:hypothetical protein
MFKANSEVQHNLTGYWTVAPGSRELEGKPARFFYVQQFRPNGSGNIFLFQDKACEHLVREVSFGWSVMHDTLIMRDELGQKSRDAVVNIDISSFNLQSKDSPEVHRVRVFGCHPHT